MTTSRTAPTPASAPRAGAGDGATRAELDNLAALEAEYLRLWTAIVTYQGVAHHEREAWLRNRAMAVLGRLAVMRRRRGASP